MSDEIAPPQVLVEIENLGGIDSLEERIDPGLTVLSGENATNRTSFLRSLATGLGGRQARVKADAETPGYVRLSMGDRTFERTVSATGDSLLFDGEGLVSSEVAEEIRPFAWLLTDNAVREALRSGDDLYEIAMRPVDTAELERRERELVRKREELEAKREELGRKKERLPGLDATIAELETEVESLETELEEARAELERADRTVSVAEEEQSNREEALREKEAAASEKRTLERDVETKRDAIAALEEQYEETKADLAAARDELAGLDVEPETVESEIRRLEDERLEVEDVQGALRTVISFNVDVLNEEENAGLRQMFDGSVTGEQPLTDQLVETDGSTQIECWTCGSMTDTEQIQTQVSRLQDQLETLSTRETELAEEIDALRRQKREYNDLEGRVDELSTEVGRLERKLEARRSELADAESDLEEAAARVEAAETALDEFEGRSEDEVLALSREVSELELELSTTRQELEETREKRRAVEAETDEIDAIEAELEDVGEELVAVRTTIQTREETIVQEFNDQMDDLIEILAYDNIERVWLTRHQSDPSERGPGSDTEFRLNIVRQTDDGAAIQDSVENLSESEREVVAVAFALAGYAAHDVAEVMPFILFDSFEMIDAERLDRLFRYFQDRAEYVIAALLPEDARVVEGEHTREIDFGTSALAD